MAYFPIFTDMKGKKALIVGGGKAALLKIQRLLPYGTAVDVTSRTFCPEIRQLAQTKEIRILPDAFQIFLNQAACKQQDTAAEELSENERTAADLLEPYFLAVSTTGDPALDRLLRKICTDRRILYNAVDQPGLCDFIFPVTIQKKSLSIGISTEGASPTAARYIKEQIEQVLPDWLPDVLDWLHTQRKLVLHHIDNPSCRAAVFRELFEACMQKRGPLSEKEKEELIEHILHCSETSHFSRSQADSMKSCPFLDCEQKNASHFQQGKVFLAGAGCGSADWLTVKSARLLQECDVLVYDDLISADIIDMFLGEERIYAGKRLGCHSADQQAISQILISRAREGKKVLRLKGGDPFVFGRGMEEVLALRKAGIAYEIIPGISSCTAIPLRMEIPVTHRKLSRGFLVISASRSASSAGSQKTGKPVRAAFSDPDWQKDLQIMAEFPGTIVVLMGFSRLCEIAQALIEKGKDPQTPVAVISSQDIFSSSMVTGTLQNIAAQVQTSSLVSPAVIVMGACVSLAGRDVDEPEQKEMYTAGFVGTRRLYDRFVQAADHRFGVQMLLEGKPQAAAQSEGWIQKLKTGERPFAMVFTSPNGVSFWQKQLRKARIDIRMLSGIQLICIGQATAEVLEQTGLFADWYASRSTVHDLAQEIRHRVPAKAVLWLFRSADADSDLEDCLHKTCQTIRWNLYSTSYQHPDASSEKYISSPVIAVGSAKAARAWIQKASHPETCTYVTLSEVTARQLRKLGMPRIVQADSIDAAALAEKTAEILRSLAENKKKD